MGGDITQPTTTSMIPQRLSTNLCRSGSTGTTPLFRKESCVAMSPEAGRVVGETYWLLGWIVVRTEKLRATPTSLLGTSAVIGIDALIFNSFATLLERCCKDHLEYFTPHTTLLLFAAVGQRLLEQYRLPDVHFPCGDDGDGNDDAPKHTPNTHQRRHHNTAPPHQATFAIITTFAAFTLALSCHSIVLLRRCCVVVALHWVVASLLCSCGSALGCCVPAVHSRVVVT